MVYIQEEKCFTDTHDSDLHGPFTWRPKHVHTLNNDVMAYTVQQSLTLKWEQRTAGSQPRTECYNRFDSAVCAIRHQNSLSQSKMNKTNKKKKMLKQSIFAKKKKKILHMSPPLHNQPSGTFDLFHETFQQNTTMLMAYLIKSCQSSLPWIVLVQNKFSMGFNKPAVCGIILSSPESTVKFLRKWTQKFLNSHIT